MASFWQPGLSMPAARAYPGPVTGVAAAPVFGIVVPGCPVQTDVRLVDSGRWMIELGFAPERFVVFLTMSEPLPADRGIGLFLAREDTMSFQYVGALTQQRPSTIIQVSSAFLNVAQPIRIVLGLSLELEADLGNLGLTQEQPLQQVQAATKVAIAERILEDLYGFVSSYARTITMATGQLASLDPGEYLIMPASFVDKWRGRVKAKIEKDSSFWA